MLSVKLFKIIAFKVKTGHMHDTLHNSTHSYYTHINIFLHLRTYKLNSFKDKIKF